MGKETLLSLCLRVSCQYSFPKRQPRRSQLIQLVFPDALSMVQGSKTPLVRLYALSPVVRRPRRHDDLFCRVERTHAKVHARKDHWTSRERGGR